MLKIIQGDITPIWSEEFKQYTYEKQPVTEKELQDWRSQGYNHSSFTGEMYGGKNPMPNWVWSVSEVLGLKKPGFVFYRMNTNDIMPTHVDHFRKYCEVFNVERKNVFRAVVFLEDWKPGHYFEMDNKCIANYTAGHFVIWSADVPHAAANIGVESRYTLQITGTNNGI